MVDESTYKGTIKARIGPIAVTLAGAVEFEERDEVRGVGGLKGQASDTRGRGGAVSLITFQLRENAEGTQVDIETDLQLSGALAQYGRGAGMISNFAGRIIDQFAECLRARIESAPTDAEADPLRARERRSPSQSGSDWIRRDGRHGEERTRTPESREKKQQT